MKTSVFAMVLMILLGNNVQAQSFKVLNPKVQQGDVLVIRINPGWMPPATSNPTIFIFGKHYRSDWQGRVLIGIKMDTPPSVYRAIFNENSLRAIWYYEDIEVSEANFDKTRSSSFIGKPRLRNDRQKQRINSAFGSKNQSEFDLTGGLGYVDPLGIARDIIDPFGYIYKNNPYRPHEGVDLKAPIGTQVMAVNNGKVVLVAKRFRAEGNMVIINHGLGIFSVYMHLSKFQVKEGDMVKRGQIIALSGDSGAGVEEPHLHFNIKIQDSYIDPLKFIDTVNQYVFI